MIYIDPLTSGGDEMEKYVYLTKARERRTD